MTAEKILIIHRYYRQRGGEDTFLDGTLLPAFKKLQVPYELCKFDPFFSKSNRLESLLEFCLMILGIETFRPSYLKVKKKLNSYNYSKVIFNNFIPTLSLKLPDLFKERKISTFMWIHNSRSICANGLLFNGKTDCVKCHTLGSRWALFQNCHRSFFKSALYAWLYRFRRVERFLGTIDLFVCNSKYSENFMTEIGRGKTLVVRIPPLVMSSPSDVLPHDLDTKLLKFGGLYYLYVGRVSFEKGADIFCEMAKNFSQKAFVLCGDGPQLEELKARAPANVFFLSVNQKELPVLYKKCEALIVPSRVKETSSLVVSEAYAFGTPIVYPEGGGAEETVKILGLPGTPLKSFTGEKRARKVIDLSEVSRLNSEFENQLLGLFVIS